MTRADGKRTKDRPAKGGGAAFLLRLLVLCVALQSFAGLGLAGHPASHGMSAHGATAHDGAAQAHESRGHAAHAHAADCAEAREQAPDEAPPAAAAVADTCTTMLCCFGEPTLAEAKPQLRMAARLTQRADEPGSPAPATLFPDKRPPRRA